MNAFSHGPFTFSPGRAIRVAGVASRRWTMSYGVETVAEATIPATATQGDVIEAFGDERGMFVRRVRDKHWPARISLIDFETDADVGHFFSESMCGMTAGIIDDRSRYWLRSEDRIYSRSVTLSEFAQIAAAESATPVSWIAGLLPDDVLAADPDDWRAPTWFELRHVIGEGSFTGITGAAAAALVGVSAQNFRKYTARDGASTRQNMSFALWHLLLHKLGVNRA